MKGRVLRAGPFNYVPTICCHGEMLAYCELYKTWRVTAYHKSFLTRSGAERFLKDFLD